jgi:IS4 transposase
MSSAPYAGGFNMRQDVDGTPIVSSFANAGGARKRPRTRAMALTTDCLVTRADGTMYRIDKYASRGTVKARTRTKSRTTTPAPVDTSQRALPRSAASIVSSYDARHRGQY